MDFAKPSLVPPIKPMEWVGHGWDYSSPRLVCLP